MSDENNIQNNVAGTVIDDDVLGESIQQPAPQVEAAAEAVAQAPVAEVQESAPADAASTNQKEAEEIAKMIKETSTPTGVLSDPVFLSRNRGSVDELSIPPTRHQDAITKLSTIPNTNHDSEEFVKWVSSLNEASEVLPKEDMFGAVTSDASREYRQYIQHNGKRLGPVNLVNKQSEGVQEVTGEKAAIQLMSHLGLGGLPRFPMYKSGFWVTFKPMLGVEFVDLWYSIQQDDVRLGRWSYGLALSGTVAYTLDRILEAAIRHVYNTSVISTEMPVTQIREYLAPQDINAFILGFLSACYPSGHYYNTACVNNPTKCNHVFEGTLNLPKIGWSYTENMTKEELDFMSNASPNIRTLEQIKKYQEGVKQRDERRILFFEGTDHEMAMTLSTPTTTQYLNESFKWISGIVDTVTSAAYKAKNDRERQTYINARAEASILMEYVHWVKSIEFGRLTSQHNAIDAVAANVIKDRATIATNLSSLSPIDSIREKIKTEIKKFIEETTVTVIGVPAYTCPVCQTPQEQVYEKEGGQKVSLVPIDILQVFVSLLTQRLSRLDS